MITNKFQNRLKEKKSKEYNSLRYKRLISEVVKKIIESNNPQLKNNDIKEISLKIYKGNDKLKCGRVKSMLKQEIVKNDVNNELQRILTDAGFNKDKLKDLYKQAEEFAKAKKDGNLLLKIADKIERANNLVDNNRVNVSQTQIIDYSKVDEAGNPAVKEVKKIETSTSNNVIDTNLNNNVANLSEKEESDST